MKKQLPIYLYYPNILGYVRVFLLFFGLYVIKTNPILGCTCFTGNLILDAADGYLARLLKQVSAFGAILDYSVDRISLASYALLLATIYPQYLLLFCLIMNLDLASHFFHMKASQHKVSHKEVASNEPWILRLYYKKVVLGTACLTHDLFFIFLYLYKFFPGLPLAICLGITSVGAVFKTVVHITQIVRASVNLLAESKKII